MTEFPAGVIAWAILLVGISLYVLGADLWLMHNGYETMSHEFYEGLHTTWVGVLLGLWFGTFFGLTAHFFLAKGH
jgi:hypothetical protein